VIATATLIVYLLWLVLAFGLRSLIQARRTGDAGWRPQADAPAPSNGGPAPSLGSARSQPGWPRQPRTCPGYRRSTCSTTLGFGQPGWLSPRSPPAPPSPPRSRWAPPGASASTRPNAPAS
jgi:hypothetical protein